MTYPVTLTTQQLEAIMAGADADFRANGIAAFDRQAGLIMPLRAEVGAIDQASAEEAAKALEAFRTLPKPPDEGDRLQASG